MIAYVVTHRTKNGQLVEVSDSELYKDYIKHGKELLSIDQLLDYRNRIAKLEISDEAKQLEIDATSYFLDLHLYGHDFRLSDKYS